MYHVLDYFQSHNFVSPAWAYAKDREGSGFLNSSSFFTQHLRCEVVDLVDPEQLRFWLHCTSLLVTILQLLVSS